MVGGISTVFYFRFLPTDSLFAFFQKIKKMKILSSDLLSYYAWFPPADSLFDLFKF